MGNKKPTLRLTEFTSRTGNKVVPLLPIELENKLKEKTQMFRKRLKIWDPGIKSVFHDNRVRWF